MRGCVAGDNLQALDYVLDDLMFQSRIEIFGVLAKDHHVDVYIHVARLHARQRADGADVGKQVHLLAKRYIDAGKAAADGSGDRALEADARAVQRFQQVWRKHLPGLHDDFGGEFHALPIDLYASGINGANGCIGHFGTNAITWD